MNAYGFVEHKLLHLNDIINTCTLVRDRSNSAYNNNRDIDYIPKHHDGSTLTVGCLISRVSSPLQTECCALKDYS